MVTNDLLVLPNVAICIAIVLRLMSYHEPNAKHHGWASWLAYFLVLAYASVPFRFFFDHYDHTSWPVIVINLIICAAICRAKGNIALVFSIFAMPK